MTTAVSPARSSSSVLAAFLLLGCGASKVPGVDGGLLRSPGLQGFHVTSQSCSDPACGDGAANPPLGGGHCPEWLPCRRYDTAQLRCNWIHNLEHGHAVLAYNCSDGCPDLVAKLSAVWEARQSDSKKRRILMTPDPALPQKIAAIVWGFGWQGDVFDAAAIEQVLSHQDEEAPEAGLGCLP
jgi:hypothetical protein